VQSLLAVHALHATAHVSLCACCCWFINGTHN